MTPEQKLLEMLTYRRPDGSKAERRFINRFIVPSGAKPDAYGNYILRIGTAPILWSSHTDTVHRDGGRQTVRFSEGVASVNKNHDCLGADCTVGVWLMLEMIEAGIEGLYIFHRGEECGRLGSEYIAKNTPGLLDGITAAIAFDRYGYTSIITHQMGKRCTSEAFSQSLAFALSCDRLPNWKSDSGGSFTDTASYTKLIPECTNISVGYDYQHSSDETQDVDFALLLRSTLLLADFSELEIKRDPSVEEKYDWTDYLSDARFGINNNEYDFDYSQEVSRGLAFGHSNFQNLLALVKQNPSAVASYLDDLGVNPEEVLRHYA